MQIHVEFTNGAIEEPGRETGKETGAEVEFRGIVREMEKGGMIAGLQYEAYEAMAERELRRIFDQINETWACQSVWFVHRLGWVPVGEASMYIRVRAPHREEAFRFCMELVDWLKRNVPIWKTTDSG